MSDQHGKPVAYVDFDRYIVCVDPNAPLVPDDRSERQKRWDDMIMACKVREQEEGFVVDLIKFNLLHSNDVYIVCDRPPVTTHPRTIDAEGMMLVNVTSFNSVFDSREYAEGIAQRAFTLFRAAREHAHACEQKIKALEIQRRMYGATHDQFNHHGGMVRQ
jgi:gamma-glutamyltranspeptidase